MCKNDKLLLLSIEDKIDSILSDIKIIEQNKQINKDRLIWLRAKLNDAYRLVHTIREENK